MLGIESSCDDTGIAILRVSDGAVLGQAIANQAGCMTATFICMFVVSALRVQARHNRSMAGVWRPVRGSCTGLRWTSTHHGAVLCPG